ncbi:SdpI family protein [Sinobaca sp. H24]|uniref:SdpI family protein n=1 Tax=Sinobaca sp. H24 TaxID=2923376 RepID=UPI002079BF1B|nr:SdpI family protein [Sinobaca sp. H24]
MNSLYGVRFPQSYESDEKWFRINKYGGRRMIIWSVPLFAAGIIALFLPPLEEANELIFSLLPLIIIIPAVESYLYARKIHHSEGM